MNCRIDNMKQIFFCALISFSLYSCSVPDTRINYSAVVLDEYSLKPVANIPVKFIKPAPSYMQKNKILANGQTDANGVFKLSERVKGNDNYVIEINNDNTCANLDTLLSKYKFKASGSKGSKLGKDWNITMDTLTVPPAGSIRFEYNDSVLNKYNADAIIIEAGNNRTVVGTSMALPPLINNYPVQGSTDYSLMNFTPNANYTFKFYTHTNGVVTLRHTKNIFIKNGYVLPVLGCFTDQVEQIVF